VPYLTKSLKYLRSSTEAIYENSLDVVIKHAREEQSRKRRKKRENSTKRRVRPGVLKEFKLPLNSWINLFYHS
jgi:hypothetical protein